MKLHESIYALRTARGLNQAELAEALEVSRQSISKWETGAAVPELEKLVKMAELFGVTLDELVRGTAEGTEATEAAAPAEETPVPPETEAPKREAARPWYQEVHRILGLVVLCSGVVLAILCLALEAVRSALFLGLPVMALGLLFFLLPRRHLIWGVAAVLVMLALMVPYVVGFGKTAAVLLLAAGAILAFWGAVLRLIRR